MQVDIGDVKDYKRIIDIRTSIEFNKDNIKGSINVPRINLLKDPNLYLNKKDTFYLLCNKGEVSLSCAKILNALGYKCYSIIGGIEKIQKK